MRRLVLAICLTLACLPVPASAQESTATPEPPSQYEQQPYRPSGFWTSTRPAKGGSYRYRMLGVGIVFALGAGFLIRRVIKRANAERAAATK